METKTLMLCLIGVISFVHLRFGYLRLSTKPSIEKKRMKTNGIAIIVIAPRIVGLRAMIAHMLQMIAGMPVSKRCMLLLALTACHEVIGRDCASQIFLPSSEIEGADISFIEAIKQISAAAATQI